MTIALILIFRISSLVFALTLAPLADLYVFLWNKHVNFWARRLDKQLVGEERELFDYVAEASRDTHPLFEKCDVCGEWFLLGGEELETDPEEWLFYCSFACRDRKIQALRLKGAYCDTCEWPKPCPCDESVCECGRPYPTTEA